MSDLIVTNVVRQPQIIFGEDTQLAAAEANRAAAAANKAEAAAAGTRSYDEVIAATGVVAGLTVSVADGLIARFDAMVPFAGSVTLDTPATTTVTDAAYTISYFNGQIYWPYLLTRTPHGNLSNLVVKDAGTSAVLVEGVDYIVDRKLGGFARAAAGSDRNVLISYVASEERYDLICADPEYDTALYAVKGGAGVRDASERMPDIGTKPDPDSSIPMRLPLFYARVTAHSVDLVKVWNLRDGIAREFEAQFLADQRRNRDAMQPLLTMLEAGKPTIWSAIGDSITAIQSETPDTLLPNGPYRDKATADGTTYRYLREGIISADLIDAIPDGFDNGNPADATHTRFGRVWELINAATGIYGSQVEYRNYSIAGTNSDDSYLGMNDPTRRAAWAEDGAHLGIILDGMNSRQVGVTLLFNRIRTLIDAKFAAGAKAVIVWGCSRPNDISDDVDDFLKVNRVLRRAAETPGWGGRTAAFIDPTLVCYGDGAGTMGTVAQDYCLANGASHPGIRQHRIEGDLARKLIFGAAGKPPGASTTWSTVYKGADIVLSNGNLSMESSKSPGAWESVRASAAKTTGKWYFEVHHDETAGGAMIGVANGSHPQTSFTGADANSASYSSGGAIFFNGDDVFTGAVQANGDTIGVAVDADAEKVWYSLNGTWQNGDPVAGTGGQSVPIGTFFPSTSMYNTDGKMTANFGASAFAHAAPAGFTTWNS